MMNRRQWISAASAAGIVALAGCTTSRQAGGQRPFFASHDVPIGVQLYALSADLQADFDGTLAKVRDLGVKIVEIAGFHDRTAQQLRNSFDRAGLVCPSAHIQPTTKRSGPILAGDLTPLIRDMHIIGATHVVMPIPIMSVYPKTSDESKKIVAALTLDDWRRTAEFLNKAARTLRESGLTLSYHNHNFEFAPHDGGTGFDLLLRETDPSLVSFELDVGWAVAAGQDCKALLRAHPHRFTQMHVKDITANTKTNFVIEQEPIEVGSGIIDWAALLPVAWDAGVRQYYVEQEAPFTRSPFESVKQSVVYLQGLSTL